MKTVRVRVKLREYTFGSPSGGYKTVVYEGEVPLTESVKRDIEAGILQVIDEEKEEKKTNQTTPDLSKLTKDELLELAKERGIDVPSKATKAQIIELLEGGG